MAAERVLPWSPARLARVSRARPRAGSISALVSPHSSGDRASASGAGCASSNLAGGASIRGDLTAVLGRPGRLFFLRVTSTAEDSSATPPTHQAAVSPMITNDFFLAKDNHRIGAQILRETKILRDHSGGRAMVATPGEARLGSAFRTMIVCRCGIVRQRGHPAIRPRDRPPLAPRLPSGTSAHLRWRKHWPGRGGRKWPGPCYVTSLASATVPVRSVQPGEHDLCERHVVAVVTVELGVSQSPDYDAA